MNDPFRNPDLSDRFQACMGAKQHLSTHRDSETYWLLTRISIKNSLLVFFLKGFPRFSSKGSQLMLTDIKMSPLKMEG